MDSVHKPCQETLPRHPAQTSWQRSCRGPPRYIWVLSFAERMLPGGLVQSLSRIPCNNHAKTSYQEILQRKRLAQRPCKKASALVSLEILPRRLAQSLQRYLFNKSCKGCSRLVEGLRDPGHGQEILPSDLTHTSRAEILAKSGDSQGLAQDRFPARGLVGGSSLQILNRSL